MKTGLFGGTFNPIHTAHLIIAEWIREEVPLDEVFFIPTAHPPHRQHDTEIIDIRSRIGMVRCAIEGCPGFRLADYESDPAVTAYSVDTVRDFLGRNPELAGNLYFIIGEDNYRLLHTWKEAAELSRLCTLVVARRQTGEVQQKLENLQEPVFVDTPYIDISASMIRERIRAGRSIRYMVPEAVERYIQEHNLYTT